MVADAENLGRAVFSRTRAERLRRSAKEGSPPPLSVFKSLFTPPKDKRRVSVDRLTSSNCRFLTKHHDSLAIRRTPPGSFHGWLVYSVRAFQSAGWEVTAEPLDCNPHHAEVSPSESRMSLADALREMQEYLRWNERCNGSSGMSTEPGPLDPPSADATC